MAQNVYGGCRDCSKCMTSSVVVGARNTGRVTLAVFTVGLSEIGFALMPKCRSCRHQRSLHGSMAGPQPFVQQLLRAPVAQPVAPPAGWYVSPSGQGLEWWDGYRWSGMIQPHQQQQLQPPA